MAIYAPPEPVDSELAAIDRINVLRRDLKYATYEPRRWLGGLRRLTFARNVQASNSIEGYDADLDDVIAAIEDEETLDTATETRLALQAYRDAMTYVLQLAEEQDLEVDTTLIKSLHYMILKYDLAKRPGRWRQGGIYVKHEPTGNLVYEGPDIELVPDLMAELVQGLRDTDGDKLVRAAMAHLNLAMIHPFADGNGRMARCLQTLVLTQEHVISPIFSSIEEYLGRNTDAYYKVLGQVGQGAWHPENDARPWLRFCLNAHYQQAQTLAWRVHAAEHLWERVAAVVNAKGLAARTTAPLVDAAMGRRLRNALYRTAIEQSDGEEISVESASRDLRTLVDAGLLQAFKKTRGRYYHGTDELLQEWIAVRSDKPMASTVDLFSHEDEQLKLVT